MRSPKNRLTPFFQLMDFKRVLPLVKRLCICLFFALFFTPITPLRGADHIDAPLAKNRPGGDIADLFAFTVEKELVLILTVNPLSPSVSSKNLFFDSRVAYRFHIDNDGDAIADQVIVCVFSEPTGNRQFIRVTGLPSGDIIQGEINTSFSPFEKILKSPTGDIQVFAGPRDDPFFFDFTAFSNGLAFTNPGKDTFKGTNVSAIVIKLPSQILLKPTGSITKLALWGSTSL